MSVMVQVEFQIVPEKVEEFKGMLKAVLPDTRAYDGCESVICYQDKDNAGTIVLYEVWGKREQQQKYLAWRVETGLMDALGPFVTAPPSIRCFDEFDA